MYVLYLLPAYSITKPHCVQSAVRNSTRATWPGTTILMGTTLRQCWIISGDWNSVPARIDTALMVDSSLHSVGPAFTLAAIVILMALNGSVYSSIIGSIIHTWPVVGLVLLVVNAGSHLGVAILPGMYVIRSVRLGTEGNNNHQNTNFREWLPKY